MHYYYFTELSISIADTILFNRNELRTWYFSDSSHEVKIKSKHKLNYATILHEFNHAKEDGDIVAAWIQKEDID